MPSTASKLAIPNIAWGVALLPFLCVPLVSLVAWHCRDTRIPNDDAGQYTQTAADIYRPLSDGKPLKFIKNMYLKRGFRPVSLPCFAALCLPLAGGDLKTATGLAMCGFYLLLYVYSFKLLRLFTSFSAAACGAAIASTLPWILQYSSVFFADVPMVAAMVAALYHAERCKTWTSLPHSAALGVALALAISLRPIEPLPAAATLLAFLLVAGWSSKRIGLADLRLASIPAASLLILLLLCVFSVLRSKELAAGLFCPALLLYGRAIARSRSPLNRCFAATVMALLGGVGLWYLPGARQTWNWIWSCSFGELNQRYKGVGELGFDNALHTIVTALGGIQLAVLAALAGAALAASLWSGRSAIGAWLRLTIVRRRASDRVPLVLAVEASETLPIRSRAAALLAGLRRAIPGDMVLAAGLLQVLLVIFVAAITPGTDLRRGYVGFYWVFLGLTIYATSSQFKWHAVRTVALGAFAAVQLIVVACSAIGPVPRALAPVVDVVHAVYPVQQRSADRNVQALHAVLERVPANAKVAAMTVAINAYSQRVFDLSALNALSSIQKSTVRFGCPCIFDALAEGYRQLHGYSYVLIDTRPTFASIPEQKRREPYSMLSEDLAWRYRQHRLADLGLIESAKFYIGDVEVVLLEWTSAPRTATRPGSKAR